ncbi:tripartite tricarboxylate transporter TctB family protein (plasmid) [Falsihalocynthiibacter sp. SS001]|uniref:tripartite tricarboxylate transporter TctB family protein n=1 Tax=Falsihalocynthiibacter sp. SS001 TaxID=3349698 RepID=UPI0036D21299
MTNNALDRITGVFFIFLGGLVALGAWLMPRFENQGAEIYQAPGLTPGFLGIGLAVCGLILAVRSARDDANDKTYWEATFGNPVHRKRILAALALTLSYGALLFGTVPYVIATFLFVFAFVVTFERILIPHGTTPKIPLWGSLTIAAALAAATSFGTYFIFKTLFLVQLP